jgi:hypothetical protein
MDKKTMEVVYGMINVVKKAPNFDSMTGEDALGLLNRQLQLYEEKSGSDNKKKISPKNAAILEYGYDVVYKAESYYETMPDKHFWSDLDAEEREDYLRSALRNI